MRSSIQDLCLSTHCSLVRPASKYSMFSRSWHVKSSSFFLLCSHSRTVFRSFIHFLLLFYPSFHRIESTVFRFTSFPRTAYIFGLIDSNTYSFILISCSKYPNHIMHISNIAFASLLCTSLAAAGPLRREGSHKLYVLKTSITWQ